ncbi:transmembrane protease serine 4-like [Melitaea cinxia]|uniref:transmembrane protease serine 4-like n=1 Tax=Melitaea cinxia TaxID=113334 RepID=UPI001E274635|nr:transmembrane protease serine 4-like [Melitaea cinxia]
MVKLTKPLTSSKWVQQATVVKYGANIPDNLPIDLIGWRKIDKTLRNLTVQTINNKVCAQQLEKSGFDVTENMICSRVLVAGGHSCPYQVGGPVFYKRVLIGIMSECNRNYVGNGTQSLLVSTSVTSFTNWIIETARLRAQS